MDQDTKAAIIGLTQFTGYLLVRVKALEAVLLKNRPVSPEAIQEARNQAEWNVKTGLSWLGNQASDKEFVQALSDTLGRLKAD